MENGVGGVLCLVGCDQSFRRVFFWFDFDGRFFMRRFRRCFYGVCVSEYFAFRLGFKRFLGTLFVDDRSELGVFIGRFNRGHLDRLSFFDFVTIVGFQFGRGLQFWLVLRECLLASVCSGRCDGRILFRFDGVSRGLFFSDGFDRVRGDDCRVINRILNRILWQRLGVVCDDCLYFRCVGGIVHAGEKGGNRCFGAAGNAGGLFGHCRHHRGVGCAVFLLGGRDLVGGCTLELFAILAGNDDLTRIFSQGDAVAFGGIGDVASIIFRPVQFAELCHFCQAIYQLSS